MMTRSLVLLCVLLAGMLAWAEELPRWEYEVDGMYQSMPPGAIDQSKVKDPDASGGTAVYADAKIGAFSYWHNYTAMMPGEYVATFRLKVSDNTSAEKVIQAYVENGDGDLGVRANQFKAPNVYQDFALPFKLKRRMLISTPIRGFAVAGVTVWADKVTVVMTKEYGDDEQLRQINFQRRADLQLPPGASGVCVGKGVYHDFFKVAEVAPFLGGEMIGCAVYTDQTAEHLRNFPATYEELVKHKVYVLADVPATALSVEQRAMLEDFVNAGGGLVVLGGPYSFGLGGYAGSDCFARILPVTLAGRYDIVKCTPPQPLKAGSAKSLAADLLAKTPPVVLYQHKLLPKPGATVQVKAGEQPLVITAPYGKGRVVAVLATPLGEAPDDLTPWWNWPVWPQLMARLLMWAGGG